MERILEIKSAIIFEKSGKKLYAKHSPHDKKLSNFDSEQLRAYEQALFKENFELAQFNEVEPALSNEGTVLHKRFQGLYVCFVLGPKTNEIIAHCAFDTLVEALKSLYKNDFSDKAVLDNPSFLFLAMDEMFFDGMIVEIEKDDLIEKASINSEGNDNAFLDQTIGQALSSLRDQFFKIDWLLTLNKKIPKTTKKTKQKDKKTKNEKTKKQNKKDKKKTKKNYKNTNFN